MAYLRVLQDLSPTINAAGGYPVIISAQDEEHLAQVRSSSGYTGEAINDRENILAKHLAANGMVTVAITEREGYPHGVAQPAILVIKKDGSVLESWAIVPSEVLSLMAQQKHIISHLLMRTMADEFGRGNGPP